MHTFTRREVIRAGAAAAGSVAFGPSLRAQAPVGPLAEQDPSVKVLNPMGRVPTSFIIDDSTCLVNVGHFCMPQFAEAWPNQVIYKRPWKSWPREIPDAFLREFGEFCAQSGVKGKYSVVPNPACVGWLDRELPGWSRKEVRDSLKLVRDVIAPNFDIHPEMVTHTRVIDLKTGKPMEEISPATMENSYPQSKKSADELAAYIAYALQALKNCELPVSGITTPGGFGNQDRSALALGIRQAVTDVFKPEIPHYFKYIMGGNESTYPKLEHVENADGEHPKLVVNVPAATGDWFGGWEGDRPSQGDKYANADASAGRMVELLDRGQMAIMFCHWPGMYSNGTKEGFSQFRQIITALNTKYRDRMIWMKLDEIARYYAAKGLTKIEREQHMLRFTAPFACPGFTLRVQITDGRGPIARHQGQRIPFKQVDRAEDLEAGTWRNTRGVETCEFCFDLPKGTTEISV